MNHVVAHGMSPVHISPHGGVGVVLEEHVIDALPEDGAIGIVHPIFRGEEMELRAEGVGGKTCAEVVVAARVKCV
jgi:hypothetical protein